MQPLHKVAAQELAALFLQGRPVKHVQNFECRIQMYGAPKLLLSIESRKTETQCLLYEAVAGSTEHALDQQSVFGCVPMFGMSGRTCFRANQPSCIAVSEVHPTVQISYAHASAVSVLIAKDTELQCTCNEIRELRFMLLRKRPPPQLLHLCHQLLPGC